MRQAGGRGEAAGCGVQERQSWPRFGLLEPSGEISEARWVVDGLRSPFESNSVGTLLPGGFEAYGRVLPPIRQTDRGHGRPQRWRDIAGERGVSFGPQIRFNELVGWNIYRDGAAQPPTPYAPPPHGTLDEPECAALAATLSRHTSTPDVCWYLLWEGYGWRELPAPNAGPPRVRTAALEHLLFTGPLTAATNFVSGLSFQSPTLWWPADRAWCVATDIEGYRTYFASTQAALDDCQLDWRLEVVQVDRDQPADPSPYEPRPDRTP